MPPTPTATLTDPDPSWLTGLDDWLTVNLGHTAEDGLRHHREFDPHATERELARRHAEREMTAALDRIRFYLSGNDHGDQA